MCYIKSEEDKWIGNECKHFWIVAFQILMEREIDLLFPTLTRHVLIDLCGQPQLVVLK